MGCLFLYKKKIIFVNNDNFYYDLVKISRVAKIVGYSNTKIISISEIPDEIIKNYAYIRENRGERWKIETESYMLIK